MCVPPAGPADRLRDAYVAPDRLPAGGGHEARRAASAHGAATTTHGEPSTTPRAAPTAHAVGRTNMTYVPAAVGCLLLMPPILLGFGVSGCCCELNITKPLLQEQLKSELHAFTLRLGGVSHRPSCSAGQRLATNSETKWDALLARHRTTRYVRAVLTMHGVTPFAPLPSPHHPARNGVDRGVVDAAQCSC